MCNRKFQTNSKKIQKILLWLHFKPKWGGKRREREKIKTIVLFRSNLTQNREFQKNRKKFKKYSCRFIESQNRLEKAEKDRKQKLSLRFVPTQRLIENSKKIEKKFRKFRNTIVASFEAIIGWNRPRNRENKNYHSVSF